MRLRRACLVLAASLLLGMTGAGRAGTSAEESSDPGFIGGCLQTRNDNRDANPFATEDEKRKAAWRKEYYTFHPTPPDDYGEPVPQEPREEQKDP